MILQVIAGWFAALSVTAKLYWGRILTFLRIAQPDGSSLDTLTGGRLHDRFERRNGAWKIAHRRTIFDWNRDAPSSEGWCNGIFVPGKPGMLLGRKGESDPSYSRS